MPASTRTLFIFLCLLFGFAMLNYAAEERIDYSPQPDERQLPTAMHSQMAIHPSITVGMQNADIIGSDNRALQAAVDYIGNLGGGTVTILEGEYLMYDSLHLRSNVTVRGIEGKTILKKADGVVSALAIDGDFGEDGFRVGYGVAIWDQNAGGFHTTVARVTGQTQNTVSISQPLMADCMIHREAIAATVYPVISGYHIENARIENITIDGNKENNIHLNGCRGAGIFLFRGHKTEMRNCRVLNYNGDGISFQQSNDVSVIDCISEKNAELGLHPGSGSQRPHIAGCLSRNNGTDGLFLCWRVRHGIFENNLLESNGRFGISIGHKDSDNLLQKNQVRKNNKDGIFFRNETLGMAGHRNRLLDNIIEDNGQSGEGAGIRIRGEVNDLLFKNNIIKQTQSVGILIEEKVGTIRLENNLIEAQTHIKDLRKNEKSG